MSYKTKILIIFLLELTRSIKGFPDYVALITVGLTFTLISKKNIFYAFYFCLFFLLRFSFDFELNNFNYLLSSLILLIPNEKQCNIQYVNYSIILYILIPIIFGIGIKVRQTGFSISTIMESTNSFLLFNFLAFFIFYKNNKNTRFLNLIILIVNQSKLAFSVILMFLKSWKSILLLSIIFIFIFFNYFSFLFPRFTFFFEQRGLVYTLFSGRFERLIEDFNGNKISLFGVSENIQNFEIEPINILFQLGIFNLIVIYIIFYNKLKYSTLSFKNKFLILTPMILAGHIMENPLIVLLFHFITEKDETK